MKYLIVILVLCALLVVLFPRHVPRILRRTVRVHARPAEEEELGSAALVFEIEGELWAQPVPEKMFLKTEIDLETGAVSISDEPTRGR